MIIVFDSNIWISELGLRSSAASAVKFYLKQEGARIGLPEVIRSEVAAGLKENLLHSASLIRSEHRKLLAGVGQLKELVLPNESQIDAAVAQIFDSLKADIWDIPLSIESSRSALQKCVAKQPPCDKSEQFRDAIIWADCVQLLGIDEIYLVTSDKAFYRDRKYEGGLADNLKQELTGTHHQLHIFPDLSSLLSSVKKPVEIQIETIVSQYLGTSPELLTKHDLKFSGIETSRVGTFATEDPTQLYLNFVLGLICSDTSGQGLSEALLNVSGEGTYDLNSRMPHVGRLWKEELKWLSNDRMLPAEVRIYAFGSADFGHKDVAHTVRYKLDN